jgi:hypothetical protein
MSRGRRPILAPHWPKRDTGDWTIFSTSLVGAFHRPLRMTVAGLWLVGVAFAGFTAPRAWQRTGVTSALPFIAVVFGLSLLAVAVLRANRFALLISAIGLGAQILGVFGSAWELAQGVHSYKARELRDLGVDPELGVALNLLYSAVASLVFAWLVARWFKNRSRFNP